MTVRVQYRPGWWDLALGHARNGCTELEVARLSGVRVDKLRKTLRDSDRFREEMERATAEARAKPQW